LCLSWLLPVSRHVRLSSVQFELVTASCSGRGKGQVRSAMTPNVTVRADVLTGHVGMTVVRMLLATRPNYLVTTCQAAEASLPQCYQR
jgi:hypothetical protein